MAKIDSATGGGPEAKTTSRRDVLIAATGAAAGAATLPVLSDAVSAQTTVADPTLDRLTRADPAARRILLKGGTIISMDPAVGDFAAGDILIEGKKIAAVGRDLGAAAQDGNAIVVDAKDSVVVPGMVDCHRHAWEGQIRGVIPNSATIAEYMGATHRGFAPHYQADDMYVGNVVTALGCIDAGITCMIDNSHNSRSAGHSGAAVRALVDSGIRAVHASGAATFGEWDKQWPADLTRLQREFFSSEDQLVTLRVFSRGLVKEDWETARRLGGLWVSIDGAGRPNSAEVLADLQAAGLLSERCSINHGYGFSDAAWQLVRDAGISINACPRSDSQWALGGATMGLQDSLDHGIRPGLSVDNDTAYSTDMFTEMHVAFHMQRWSAHQAAARKQPNPPAPLKMRDLLEFATVRGAENAGLARKIGTLTPGKEADIVVVRADDINTMPLTNAVSTVVSYAHTGNIDAVFIAGHLRKWRGKLVGHDLSRIRQMVHASRDRLFARRGVKLDVLG
jgi:5-methylthioadenosine/S-adenosylhomocysteine deaminase